jgi:acyl-coenzyme A thioesterase PaaI-like protein
MTDEGNSKMSESNKPTGDTTGGSFWSDSGTSPLDLDAKKAFQQQRRGLLSDQEPRLLLAQATRQVLQHSATSMADDDLIGRAADLLAQAAELLEGGPHGRTYHGTAEGAVGGAPHGFISYSPVTGPLNALASMVALESSDREITATVTYGSAYEGPPGCLHGGLIAAIFDEVLGFAQALSGTPGMTGRLEVTYRSPTPLHQALRVTGRFDGVQGRKIMTSGEIYAGDRLCAEAVGTFISVNAEKFAQLNLARQHHDDPAPG